MEKNSKLSYLMASSEASHEDSEEFDEAFVLVKLNGLFDLQASVSEAQVLKIWGIDSDEQLLQLDDKFFKGQISDCVGTNIFFERRDRKRPNKIQTTGQTREGNKPQTQLQYCCHSTKVLSMDRVFLQPKKPSVENDSTNQAESSQEPKGLTSERKDDCGENEKETMDNDQ